MTPIKIALGALLAGALVASAATAQEVTLKAGFFIPPGKSLYRQAFDQFITEINERGKGQIKIPQVVGPESISAGQWCNAVSNGILDLGGLPPSYCSNLVRGIEALDVAGVPPPEQRQSGAYDYIRDLFAERAGSYFLAQYGWGARFHIFTNKPVASIADFKGMRLRTTPAYTAFFEAIGAQTMRTGRGEVFTAMERGVVDGYANPMSEVQPMGWHEVTKYVVDPGFYNPSIIVTINLDRWRKLNDPQRALLEDMGVRLEGELSAQLAEADRAAGEQLIAGGIKRLALPADEAQKFVKVAYDSQWQSVIEKSPDFGPTLRKLLKAE